MIYVQPMQTASVNLFQVDSSGTYQAWTTQELGSIKQLCGRRVTPTLKNKGITLCIKPRSSNTCRETLSNSLYAYVSSISLSKNRTITLTPPSDSNGRSLVRTLSTLEFRVAGSESGHKSHIRPSIGIETLFRRSFNLAKSKESMREVYNLMDAVLGTVAMLMDGPSAYIRPRVGSNTVCAAKQADVTITKFNPGRGIQYTANYKPAFFTKEKTVNAWNTVKYTGLSNFWIAHPASFSIIMGIAKNCLQLWFDGRYDEIDEEVGITSLKRWLATMSKKETFSKKDKEELVEVLEWFLPYLSGVEADGNKGGYPLNKHLYPMFLLYTQNPPSKTSLKSNWSKLRSGPYGLRDYGFVTWCKRFDLDTVKSTVVLPSSVFNGSNWDGLQGTRLGFTGFARREQ